MKLTKKYWILEEGAESSIEVCTKLHLCDHGGHYSTRAKAKKALELFLREMQAHHYSMGRIYGIALKKLGGKNA